MFAIAPSYLFAQTLTSSVSSLPSFGNCVINLATAAQKFTIGGSGLTNNVKLTPPASFEIATNCVSQYTSNPIFLNIDSGILSSTTVFVRLSPSLIGNVNGAINIESIGANEINISVSGVSVNWSIPTANGEYYGSTTDLSGAELKTALYNKISAHTVISYSGLWNTYATTDYFYNGKVWDIYSTNICGITPYDFTFGTNQCGNYSKESDCYNREHSFPQSWFGSASPMGSDMFHIYPTDGKVNGERSNYPYGEVSSATFTSLQGGKLGA
ncbi:MAG: endonuclease, partial [Bacteroidia bacterium]|nr:endonuclease [Bacteroidia bacterium]